jgi:hypothetical protein
MEWERTLAAPKKKTATSGLLAQEHPSATAATAGTAATAATPQTEEPAAMHGSGSSYGTAPSAAEPPGGPGTGPGQSKSWYIPGGRWYKAAREYFIGMRS